MTVCFSSSSLALIVALRIWKVLAWVEVEVKQGQDSGEGQEKRKIKQN